jgi:ribosomal protein L5
MFVLSGFQKIITYAKTVDNFKGKMNVNVNVNVNTKIYHLVILLVILLEILAPVINF